MKSTAKNKVKLGKEDLLDESYLDPKHHKVRITTFIDGDVLEEIKRLALVEHLPYQTFLNKFLRDCVFKTNDLEERVTQLEGVLHKFRKSGAG